MNAAKIWTRNEKVVQLLCEIIYERNFENNFIVFFNDVLYFFHIINFYNFSNPFSKYENSLYSHNFVFLNFYFNSMKKKSIKIFFIRLYKFTFIISWEKFKNVNCFKSCLKFKKTLKSCLFCNIIVNNWLKHIVLRPLNAKFCYLPCYPMEKIDC